MEYMVADRELALAILPLLAVAIAALLWTAVSEGKRRRQARAKQGV